MAEAREDTVNSDIKKKIIKRYIYDTSYLTLKNNVISDLVFWYAIFTTATADEEFRHGMGAPPAWHSLAATGKW